MLTSLFDENDNNTNIHKNNINNNNSKNNDSNSSDYIIKSDRNMQSSYSINDSYEIKDPKTDILKKNENYIKYVTLNREGYEFIHKKDYSSGLKKFNECKNYLNDLNDLNNKIQKCYLLINISICHYYNGNFTESRKVINEAKSLNDSISLEEKISTTQKLELALKLFINSSLVNLSINNYDESKEDINNLISIIKEEKDYNKKYSYYKRIILTLFKVKSLINFDEDNNVENSFDEKQENLPVKIIMKDFLNYLLNKDCDFGALIKTFKKATQKYKSLNDYNGYYFSLFYQYLLIYDQQKNNSDLEEINEIKKNISISNNNLIGEEFINYVKVKDIDKLLSEFKGKIYCVCEIFQLLQKYEEKIFKSNEYEEDEDEDEESERKNILSKNHIKINSPIFVKLLLKYNLYYLEKKKENSKNKENNNKNLSDDNYNVLIKELKLIIKKIESDEINIDNINLDLLDEDMIKSFKNLFTNLIYLRKKTKLYLYNKIKKLANNELFDKILEFLHSNGKNLRQGLDLFKINFKTNGYKLRFYSIDGKNLLFNIRKKSADPNPSKSYSLKNDIIKVQYGIKSQNLKKSLLSEHNIQLLRKPWLFISIITKSRSIDLYSPEEKEEGINTLFYGLKYYFVKNDMNYKINSTTYFLLVKIKIKLALKIRKKLKDKSKDNKSSLDYLLVTEKAIQKIPFIKLFLLYNKYK